MSFLSSTSKDTAWIRIDRDRIDASAGEDVYHGFYSANLAEGIKELADWLATRSRSHCYVTISSQCCFISEFALSAGSGAASDTAIRFAAEACLPLAVEDMAAVYFRNDNLVLFVAVRKILLQQLQALPVAIKFAVPESLLISSGQASKSKAGSAAKAQTDAGTELIAWKQLPVHWNVVDSEAGDSAAMLDEMNMDSTEGNMEFFEWKAEQGLELAQAAFQKAPDRIVRQIDFMADPTLKSDHTDAASASVVRISQIVFCCCLILICGLLYRRGNLDRLVMDLTEQRTQLVKTVFQKSSSRISDRKLLSELKLRRGQHSIANEWLSAKSDPVGVFSAVLMSLDSVADVNLMSVDSGSGSVEVICQVQTKGRTTQLVKELSASGFDAEILSQRPTDGLLKVQLLVTQREQVAR